MIDLTLIAHDQLTLVQAKQHVRTLRRTLRVTQQGLGDMLGVTNITVHRWENGKALPSPMAWRLLAMLNQWHHKEMR